MGFSTTDGKNCRITFSHNEIRIKALSRVENIPRFLKSAMISGLFLIQESETTKFKIISERLFSDLPIFVVKLTFDELTDAFDRELRHKLTLHFHGVSVMVTDFRWNFRNSLSLISKNSPF